MREEIERPSEAGDDERSTLDVHGASTRGLAPAAAGPPDDDDGIAALLGSSERRPRLGRYVVLGTLGRGGMGTVLEAFDRTLDRRVALKVLHRHIGEQHTKRLLREAQALAKLSHPNVVQVYEVGEARGRTFIAMELVRGCSLRKWLSREPRPSWQDCVRAYLQAGEGLAAAHARGLVHRDFKPGNTVIDDAGRVHVLDFGLARRVEEPATAQTSVELSVEEAALEEDITHAGEVMGTPGYMPPEQMRGLEVDARSDQFSYCVALYEALYGERPFAGRTLEELMAAMASRALRPQPRETEVPAAVRAVVLRGLAAEPGERWPSMAALLGELRRAMTPPRRSRVPLGLAGGLAVIGLGLWRYADVGYRCEGARAQLQGVWDEARAHAIEQAIVGTGLPYAADTWVRVRERLDAYASAWVREHTEACEATSVRHEQSPEVMDLRMACLRERRLALQETVGVLGRADATRVEHAVELVTGLASPSTCADVEALRAELPPLEDPAAAAEVEVLRERLVQARLQTGGGEYADADATATAVLEQAEARSYVPLATEARLVRGLARDALGRWADAEQDLQQAYLAAAELGLDAVEARAVTTLTLVVGHRQARYEAGLQWGTTALAVARRLRADPEAEALALDALGLVLLGKGDLPAALVHLRRAAEIKERTLGPDHPGLADSLNAAGSTLLTQGKLEAALADVRRAVDIRERVLGPGHPDVAASLQLIGLALESQGKLPEALDVYQRSLEIYERALGPDHPNVAVALTNTGNVRLRRGELDDALVCHRRALAIHERAQGPEHPDVARALTNVGRALAGLGDVDAALASYQRGLAILERTQGPGHPDVASALHDIATVHAERGEHELARAELERVRSIVERSLGPTHPLMAYPLVDLARLALAQHDPRVAREHTERAVAVLEAAAALPEVLAEARFVLALALGPEERRRARTLAEQAREAYAPLADAKRKELAELDAWLAEHPAP